MGDKQEGTEMARAADSAITSAAAVSQIQVFQRLIVTDDDSIEKSKRAERTVQGKPCLFKLADELTENPDICFCMDVAPECKDYRLQALLHQMDKMLLEGQTDSGGYPGDGADQDEFESVEEKIKDIERKQKLARSVFAIDTQNKKKNRIGRSVFYVTVGQMKHTQIVLKPVMKQQS
jgi:hypothetical protein